MRWLEALGVFRTAPDPRPRGEIEGDLDAEFEHHLACLRDELIGEGLDPAAAESEARRRFGNPRPLQRECLQIRIGERIMLQRFHVVTTATFALACLWLGFENRSMRAESALAMDELQRALSLVRERLDEQVTPEPVEEIVLRVGDRLRISGPESLEAEVALDGRFLFPILGWVRVAGLTRPEAEALLTEQLRPFYADLDHLPVRVEVTR